MSGREPKPAWAEVPAPLRADIEALIGGAVIDAEIVWGGFGPSATFGLTRADGLRFFCKGTHPGQTTQGHEALLRERRNYETFAELSRFGPRYLGGADHGDWHMAVLESVRRTRDVPPWPDDAVDGALALIAEFHAASPARAAGRLKPVDDVSGLAYGDASWKSLLAAGPARDGFLALFDDGAAAARWLDEYGSGLAALVEKAPSMGGPRSWLHLDIRSDNLIFAADRVHLVDWPMLAYGPTLLDVGFFLPSLAGEGGPDCATALRLYARKRAIAFEDGDIAIATAMISGFFAARAGEPPVPRLPRLRWVQKLQLFPAVDWLCGTLGIPALPLPRPYGP